MDKKILGSLIILAVLFTIGGIYYSQQALAAQNMVYYGSEASKVRQVQQKLRDWNYMKEGAVDGNFGWQTEQGIREFQRKNGLQVDGKAGPQTLNAMGLGQLVQKAPAKTAYEPSSGTTTSDETYILAQCINGEARGEPYIGQVAIAAVVLNRVNHASFPNSINGVIFQPGAFTAVADGQMFLTPNESAFKAAKDALAGWDPSGGAIYYYNPVTATNRWIYGRPIIKTIGKHVFAN